MFQKIMKVFNDIINIAFYPFLALFLAFVVLYFCGIHPFITMSGSMEPAIHTGSVCFVNTKADYDEIVEGDIIAFEMNNGAMVTHRVVAVTDKGLETMGDANGVTDGISTTRENFRGKTLFSIPYVGFIIKHLQNPTVLAMIVILLIGNTIINAMDAHDAKKEAQAAAEAEAQANAEAIVADEPAAEEATEEAAPAEPQPEFENA